MNSGNNETEGLNLYINPRDLSEVLGITVQGLHKFLKEKGIETRLDNSRSHRITPENARKILEAKGIKYPRRKINLHNLKGGVGKTTSAHALATRAATYGFRVLAIDLDQQANLTSSFGIQPDPKRKRTFEALYEIASTGKKESTALDLVTKIDTHLHLIESNLSMANFDTKLTLDNTFSIQSAIKDSMALINADENYDLIFIDSPPALSKVTTMAHFYSDLILIPIESEKFSLDGLEIIFQHLERMKKTRDLDTRIFINKYDNKPRIDFLIAGEVAKKYGENLCETVIPFTSGLKASIAEGESVWASQKKHNALAAFDNLLREILDLDNLWGKAKKSQHKFNEHAQTV